MTDKPQMTVYLAGPIMDRSDDDCKVWREYVQDKLPGINFLNPMRRDYRDLESIDTAREIVENDKDDIMDSDVVLVHHDQPSVGTSMEIMFAFELGKYVLVVKATKKPLSPWILYHSNEIVATLEEAIEKLKKIEEQYNVYEVLDWDDAL